MSKLQRNQMHGYQNHIVDFALMTSFCGLFVGLGLGKTVSTLTVIDEIIYNRFEANKVLIIAPKLVAQNTWTTEAAKWEHLSHLRTSLVLGSEKERLAALKVDADVYVINRENVVWLCALYSLKWPFKFVVIDESSSFKNHDSKRFKALKKMRPFMERVIELTGTPTPNGLIDLWAPMYLLDQGTRLGTSITRYRSEYFKPGQSKGHIVYSYALKNGKETEQLIYNQIDDICISMSAKDHLDLPERLDQNVEITLPPDVLKKYKEFEKEQVLEFLDGTELTAVNAAALMIKLLQFANGAVFTENPDYIIIHDEKIKALEEDIEAANGSPFLVFYQYSHDRERILQHFKHLKPVHLKSGKESTKIMESWNRGEITLMVAHAASAGHGLNLQYGGHLMGWYGINWSLELYEQAIGRLDRQGQTNVVVNRHYVCKGTADMQVLPRLSGKMADQKALMEAVKAIIKSYE